MSKYAVKPTGNERRFDDDEIIVSKTDPKGKLTYVNQVFCKIALFTPAELMGQPHSIVRHPDMPRCVFKLLWDTLQSGEEVFAYVKNMAKNGDHYWVLAHVTPTFDAGGAIVGYHSNRRTADRAALARIEPLYAQLLAEEARHASDKDGMLSAYRMLQEMLRKQGVEYNHFVFTTMDQAA
ncbi:MAG: PAS domain-containing protein [Alphaproteobacteria bacterium]|nr:PAS domain-containing protein [Alphaproteobacteria bacterium]